jgi:hypothetical protein
MGGRVVQCILTIERAAAAEQGYGATTAAAVAVLAELNYQISLLETRLPSSLISIRTRRSTTACPAWAPAPWPNSATPPTATPTPKPAKTTPAPHRSPASPANYAWSPAATPATNDSPTPATDGRSAPASLPRRPNLLRPTTRPVDQLAACAHRRSVIA